MPNVHLRDANIYYEIHGNTTNPPLILIMGLGMNIHSWDPLLPYLSQAYCCVVFYNRGSDSSSLPEKSISIETLADDVALLMDVLGFARAHVLGLSMGGMIAQEFSLKYPHRLGGLILVSTGPRLSKQAGAAYQMSIALRQAGQSDLAALQELLWLMDEAFFEDEQKVRSFKRIWRGIAPTISLIGYEAQLKACLNFDARLRLSQIQAPTLIAHGKNDITAPFSRLQELVSGIPHAVHRPYDGGHLFFLMNGSAKLFATDTIEFLANLSL